MNSFDDELQKQLDSIRAQNLFRELRRVESAQGPRIEVGGRTFLNFSSNDYLGLANEPALKEAAIKATEKFGVGSGASRLICGSLAPHHELEEALAAWKGTEAALSFSSGYATAVGTICALLGKDDIIILDKLVHASIVDAARLSGAKIRVFDHNDLNDLEKILNWAEANFEHRTSDVERRVRVLIVTESVFSMDGDLAPLREIVALKEKSGAWLMVDEAHATGIFGKRRRGLAEELGISEQIEIQMGTLGKALGASGGYICGSRRLIDLLVNRARSFIFSTAPVPVAAAAAKAGIDFISSRSGEVRRAELQKRCSEFQLKILVAPKSDKGGKTQKSNISSAIIPLIVGDETKAVELAAKLREKNIFVPAIRFPTVARGQARLRVTLTAAHTCEDVDQLFAALADLKFQI